MPENKIEYENAPETPDDHFDCGANAVDDDDARYQNYVGGGDNDDDEGVIIQGCPGQTDPWPKGRAGL